MDPTLDLPGVSASAGLIKFVQTCLILLGMTGSLVVLQKLIRHNAIGHEAPKIGFLQRSPGLLLGVCYLLLLIL